MKPRIENGKLTHTPRNIVEGVKRLEDVEREIARMKSDLGSPAYAAHPRFAGSLDAYTSWKRSATSALKLFRTEWSLLSTWMSDRGREVTTCKLLAEAYTLLKDLELDVDFEDDEQDLMRRLDEYVAHKESQPEKETGT